MPEVAQAAGGVSRDSVTAPKALESSAVVVTPIWTADRKRLGFDTSVGHPLAAPAALGAAR